MNSRSESTRPLPGRRVGFDIHVEDEGRDAGMVKPRGFERSKLWPAAQDHNHIRLRWGIVDDPCLGHTGEQGCAKDIANQE